MHTGKLRVFSKLSKRRFISVLKCVETRMACVECAEKTVGFTTLLSTVVHELTRPMKVSDFREIVPAAECPCVDAPVEARGFSRFLTLSVQVLPCVRPVDAAVHTPLACMEIADRVQTAQARSRRSDIFTGFPNPVF